MKTKATLRAGKFFGLDLIEAHPYLIIAKVSRGFLYSLQATESTNVECFSVSGGIIGTMSEQEIRALVNPPDGINIFNETTYTVEVYDKVRSEWLQIKSARP